MPAPTTAMVAPGAAATISRPAVARGMVNRAAAREMVDRAAAREMVDRAAAREMVNRAAARGMVNRAAVNRVATVAANPRPADDAGVPGDGAADDAGTIPEDGNDLAGSDFVLLVVLGTIAVAAILVAMHLGSSRQNQRDQARVGERQRTAGIIGSVRWITDQASMEIMRLTDPRQLSASWQATRSRCMDAEAQIAAAVAAESDLARRETLDDLGRACAALRVALEADVALRTDPVAPTRPDLVTLSTQTVQQRRSELQFALVDLERTAR